MKLFYSFSNIHRFEIFFTVRNSACEIGTVILLPVSFDIKTVFYRIKRIIEEFLIEKNAIYTIRRKSKRGREKVKRILRSFADQLRIQCHLHTAYPEIIRSR